MTNLSMYCISMNPDHLEIIKKLNYLPVGLGNLSFNSEWITDKSISKEISHKNKYYGEYTFHYKLWKNNLIPEKKWVGFCQYRKFWINRYVTDKKITFDQLKNLVIRDIPKEIDYYDIILGENLYINQLRISKFLKKNFKKIILNPSLLFRKHKRTIKFHFDLMHGEGNLEKAISLLDHENKKDFLDFVNCEVSFNPHNMFICKNKKLLLRYYDSVFLWLEKCEKIFGFDKLKGYGLQRIYGFLAERYLSYWFKKNSKFYLMPIYFKDLNDYL